MNQFIESGWEFGGHADAAAKASDKGAALGGEILVETVTIYQITESGWRFRPQSKEQNIGRTML